MTAATPPTIEPRVALVTGAASGIGLASAERFAAAGMTVILADVSPDTPRIAAELAGRSGVATTAVVVDLADHDAVLRLADTALAWRGRVDVLLNNAGIHPKHAGGKCFIEHIDDTQWQKVLAINLTAPFLLCRELLPQMKQRGWGRVINTASVAGRTGTRTISASYAATKHGVVGLTRATALECAGHGVTVNAVAPGPIETALTLQTSAENRAASVKNAPMGRYGTAAEVAALIAFLATDDAAFITGAVYDINGGSVMV